MRRLLAYGFIAAFVAGCAAKPPQTQTFIAGQAVNLQELTADDVARAVQITPRGDEVFFQAPTIQTNKLVDLHSAGKEMGISLGNVERVRFGYLFGVWNRATGAMRHHVLFQSNFITGNHRYVGAYLPDGTPLQFNVTRAPDPCVPNCFPVVEALIVTVPDDVLRADQSSGLVLSVALDNGETVTIRGIPAYVQGYLQAVDRYRAG